MPVFVRYEVITLVGGGLSGVAISLIPDFFMTQIPDPWFFYGQFPWSLILNLISLIPDLVMVVLQFFWFPWCLIFKFGGNAKFDKMGTRMARFNPALCWGQHSSLTRGKEDNSWHFTARAGCGILTRDGISSSRLRLVRETKFVYLKHKWYTVIVNSVLIYTCQRYPLIELLMKSELRINLFSSLSFQHGGAHSARQNPIPDFKLQNNAYTMLLLWNFSNKISKIHK